MKKFAYALVLLIILSLFLAGCGNDGAEIPATDDSSIIADKMSEDVSTTETTETIETTETSADTAETSIETSGIDTIAETIDDADEMVIEDGVIDITEDAEEEASDSTTTTNFDEPLVISITRGIYPDPSEPVAKVGQEVVFINQPVDGKKDTAWTLVGDNQDFFSSDVMQVYDQYSHIYSAPGLYTVKISPGGAFTVEVVE